MKNRILFFNGTLGAGGAERVMTLLANHFLENGEKVEIVLYYNKPIFYNLNKDIKITSILEKNAGRGFLYNLIWLRKYIARNADIVISFNASMNIYVLLAMIGLKNKIIVADRNDPRKIPKKNYMRIFRNLLYHFADGIVVQNKGNIEYFDNFIKKKSTIIYNPVELGDYKGKAFITPKKKRIVTIGRTILQKNQKMLIEAFSRVKKIHQDYTLTIYGEGELHKELKQYAISLGVGDSVELPGAVKNVHDLILDAEIFVLSSNYEGMPNALIEAMVLGLPVISTNVSGATDLIINEENGLLVEVGNLIALEKALLKFIESKELRKKCSLNSIRIANDLKINIIVEQWRTFINWVLEKGKK